MSFYWSHPQPQAASGFGQQTFQTPQQQQQSGFGQTQESVEKMVVEVTPSQQQQQPNATSFLPWLTSYDK